MLNISVALAIYNGSSYIIEQLDSIRSQIRQPDEVILVDDCSTDNSYEITENYIKENNLLSWKLYKNETNLGYKRNFYKAISLSRGDIIFTCDQDDIWCDDKIETIAGLFAKNDDMMAVSTSFLLIDKNNYPIEKSSDNNYGLIYTKLNKSLSKISLKTIMRSNISPGCTSAFRRRVADVFLQNSDNKLPHDYEINLIAASLEGLFFYNKPLIKYRIHDSNTLGLIYHEQTRLEVAKEKCDASFVIMKSSSDSSVFQMYDKRLNALKSGNITEVFKLFLSSKYRGFLSLHERIGDISYVLRSKK